jgi:O-antigen/teichoic acid export membrane protein
MTDHGTESGIGQRSLRDGKPAAETTDRTPAEPNGSGVPPRLRTSSTQLVTAQLLSQVSIFVAAAIYARLLGPYDRGLYFLIVSTVVVMNILLNMGFSSYAVVSAGRGDETLATLFGGSITLSAVAGVLSLGGGLLLFPALRMGPLRGLTVGMAALAFGLAGVSILTTYLIQVMVGFRMTKALAVIEVATEVACDATGIVLVTAFHLGLPGALVGLSMNALSTVVAMGAVCWVRGGHPRFGTSTLRHGLRFGIQKYIGLSASYLLLRLDVYLVNIFRDPSVVGVYSVAESIAEKLWLATAVLAQVAYPVISGARQKSGAAMTARLSRISIVIGTFAAGVLVLACWPGIQLTFGPAYRSAFLMVILFMPGVVVMGVARAVDPYLAGTLFRPLLSALVAGIALVAAVPIYVVLIRSWGGDGAAAATSVVYGIYALTSSLVYRRTGGVDRLLFPYRRDFVDVWGGLVDQVRTVTRRLGLTSSRSLERTLK